ncbi:hypothetical protein PG984_011689 [Apiospora sp. TS-2023a]
MSMVLSIFCMGLILGILIRVQNQPTRSWDLNFTPNALISVCTTVGKIALMIPVVSCISQLKWSHFVHSPHPLDHLQRFDDASRGPWGAFRLLMLKFSLGHKAHLFTTWGLALVTVAGLAMEPTAQNVLDQVSRESLMTDVRSRIAVASAYQSRAYPFLPLTYQNNYWPSNELIRFQSSTIDAVINGETTPQFSCASPASRCTWPSFTTLGVCSSYRNVTAFVTQNCRTEENSYVNCSYYNIPAQRPDFAGYPMRMLFGGNPSQKGDQGLSTACTSGGGFGSHEGIAICTIIRARSILEAISKTELSDYGMPALLPVEVLEIHWFWCSQMYTNLSVGGGVHDKPEGDIHTEELTWSADPVEPLLVTKDNRTRYDVKSSVDTGLESQIFMFDGLEFFSVAGVDLAYHLLAADDIGELARRVAGSFTTRIRNVDGPTADNYNATWVEGDAFMEESYFDVRWPWLILPLLETLLAGLLLVATMFVTRGEPLLKTSVLAFLLHPLAGWTDDEMRPAQLHHESMKALAKNMKGKLAYDGMGSAVFTKTA